MVSHATFCIRFCLQALAFWLTWLVKGSQKSRILLTKQVFTQFWKVNFESIHYKSNLSDLETDVRLRILCQWWLISREDSGASCPLSYSWNTFQLLQWGCIICGRFLYVILHVRSCILCTPQILHGFLCHCSCYFSTWSWKINFCRGVFCCSFYTV